MAKPLLFIALLPTVITAYLQVNYPLNQQFPPVAHVDTPYQFQFAPTTFLSDSDWIQYALVESPSWLSLDSKSRTLSGTPRSSDVGEIHITITGAGAAGAVASMASKLLVSADDVPKIKANITQVLSKAGSLSGPQTLSLKPAKIFDISFPPEVFASNGKPFSYYATLSDHTPLPAWVSFNASSMHLTGTAPAADYPQAFDILLVACDTSSYAVSSLLITLAVSKHQLVFAPFSRTIEVSQGGNIDIADIKNTLLLDGSPTGDKDIQSVVAKGSQWLKFDNKTFEVSGSAPSGKLSQDLTITAKDQFGDSAQLNIHLLFSSEFFSREIGQINITAGAYFEYAVPRDILAKDKEIVTVDLSSLSDFLHFDATKLVISGTVPDKFSAQDVSCSLTATSDDTDLKDTQIFTIRVVGASDDGSGTTDLSPGSGAFNPQFDGRRTGLITGSIIGAICGVFIIGAFALCIRRRRKAKTYLNPTLPKSPKKSDISRPMYIPYGWPDIDVNEDHDLEKGKDAAGPFVERSPETPPRLDLDLSVDKGDNHSISELIDSPEATRLIQFNKSSFGLHNDVAPSQHPSDSMKIPTELAKRALQKSDTFRKHKRRTTTVYQDQIHRSSGLPVNRRITGMGHGRNTSSRSNTDFSQSSIRRPLSTSSYSTTRCTSTFSMSPSAVPKPPIVRRHTAKVIMPTEERRSIRVVPSSTRNSLLDRRVLHEKRTSYFRKRASAQSPFFSAGGSRESSSCYRSPPAFIAEAQSSPIVAAIPSRRRTIVRPDEDVVEGKGKELPDTSRTQTPSTSPVVETGKREFPGSLRQTRLQRPFTALTAIRNRVEKSYARPETSAGPTSIGLRRRASTLNSLRAIELKASLNNLTGSEIFKDAELSDSVYTDEEDDIEEAERRTTVKPGHYVLPPLKIDTQRRGKRNSAEKSDKWTKRESKRDSKRDGKRELKRTSERDPTPYYLASHEHGGKENESSTYSLGAKSSPIRSDMKRKTIATSSPQSVKPTTRRSRSASDVRKSKRASRPLARQESTDVRHSRKSIHSRDQSQLSEDSPGKTTRHRSRTQSTAYPFFDAASIDPNRSSIGNAVSTAADAVCLTRSSTKRSLVLRDMSGNLTFYDDEEPTVEELRSSSIGIRSSNGCISPIARQSRLASLHESSQIRPPQPPRKSSRRDTAIPVPFPSNSSTPTAVRPAGLGLFPVEARAEICSGDKDGERTPLSTLQGGNRANFEVTEGDRDVAKGRQTWSNWKSVFGRGSRWVSGNYWDKQGKDDKAFI